MVVVVVVVIMVVVVAMGGGGRNTPTPTRSGGSRLYSESASNAFTALKPRLYPIFASAM